MGSSVLFNELSALKLLRDTRRLNARDWFKINDPTNNVEADTRDLAFARSDDQSGSTVRIRPPPREATVLTSFSAEHF